MATLTTGLHQWMEGRDIASLEDMRGMMSWQRSRDRSVYTRANYLRILEHSAALPEHKFGAPDPTEARGAILEITAPAV
jgi:dihydroorotate dehydrogenase (fumarate)